MVFCSVAWCSPRTRPQCLACLLWQVTATMRALTAQSLSSSTRTNVPAKQGQSRVPAAHCASPSAGSRRVAAFQTQLQALPAAQRANHMQSEQLHGHRLAPASATSPAGQQQQQQQQPDTSFVPLAELRQLCSKALSTIGYTKEETVVLMEVCAASASKAVQPAPYFATAPCCAGSGNAGCPRPSLHDYSSTP
jgi:hypothetical protein